MAAAEDVARALDTPSAARAGADRLFFGAMALYCGITIFGGFTSTFYLRSTLLSGAAPLRTTVVIHGVLFTTWVVLFLVQTALISANRRDVHRRLGLAGAVVIAGMAVIGIPLIAGFEQSHGEEPPLTLAVHLLGNVAPLALFVGFAACGVLWRERSQVHKRLMLFATLALQPAGFARLIGWLGLGQSLNVPCYAVLCAACPLYDLAVDRRVRLVSLLGALLLFGEVYVTDVLFTYIQL